MKKGLILEGGAMRGMFTAGVMDVMMENGIEYDGAVGVSAGAVFGCNYKSKQIGRVLRYNTKFCKDRRYSGLYAWITDGNIFSKRFCYDIVPLKYDIFDLETYENNPMEFWVVTTDIDTGEAYYHRYDSYDDHGFEWLRASASMPLVSQIVKIDDRRFLDGGISDSIPLKFFENEGYDRNVVVLTQPRDYRKEKPDINGLIRFKYRKYPKFLETLENRPRMYNEELEYIEKREKEGDAFVIAPKAPLEIKKVEKDPEVLRKVYELGREAALERLDELRTYLELDR